MIIVIIIILDESSSGTRENDNTVWARAFPGSRRRRSRVTFAIRVTADRFTRLTGKTLKRDPNKIFIKAAHNPSYVFTVTFTLDVICTL